MLPILLQSLFHTIPMHKGRPTLLDERLNSMHYIETGPYNFPYHLAIYIDNIVL